ncbi:hypothetical protein [Azohydromonas sediminis]|nr:hypothetical protein [Azohydromonas sediminis]
MHDALIESALRLGHRDVSHILRHDPAIAWAVKASLSSCTARTMASTCGS